MFRLRGREDDFARIGEKNQSQNQSLAPGRSRSPSLSPAQSPVGSPSQSPARARPKTPDSPARSREASPLRDLSPLRDRSPQQSPRQSPRRSPEKSPARQVRDRSRDERYTPDRDERNDEPPTPAQSRASKLRDYVEVPQARWRSIPNRTYVRFETKKKPDYLYGAFLTFRTQDENPRYSFRSSLYNDPNVLVYSYRENDIVRMWKKIDKNSREELESVSRMIKALGIRLSKVEEKVGEGGDGGDDRFSALEADFATVRKIVADLSDQVASIQTDLGKIHKFMTIIADKLHGG